MRWVEQRSTADSRQKRKAIAHSRSGFGAPIALDISFSVAKDVRISWTRTSALRLANSAPVQPLACWLSIPISLLLLSPHCSMPLASLSFPLFSFVICPTLFVFLSFLSRHATSLCFLIFHPLHCSQPSYMKFSVHRRRFTAPRLLSRLDKSAQDLEGSELPSPHQFHSSTDASLLVHPSQPLTLRPILTSIVVRLGTYQNYLQIGSLSLTYSLARVSIGYYGTSSTLISLTLASTARATLLNACSETLVR